MEKYHNWKVFFEKGKRKKLKGERQRVKKLFTISISPAFSYCS